VTFDLDFDLVLIFVFFNSMPLGWIDLTTSFSVWRHTHNFRISRSQQQKSGSMQLKKYWAEIAGT